MSWGTLYNTAKRNSDKRLILFNLSRSEFDVIVEQADGRCMVSGIPFELARFPGSARRPFAPSLDRIDSRKGYTATNCRLVCVLVNLALNQWGMEPLMRVARNLVAREREIKAQEASLQVWQEPEYYTAKQYLGVNAPVAFNRISRQAQRYCEENGIEYFIDHKTNIPAFPLSVLEIVQPLKTP